MLRKFLYFSLFFTFIGCTQNQSNIAINKTKLKENKMQTILNDIIDNEEIFGTSFCIKDKNRSWCGASGNMQNETQYFIASTTKLYTTAMVLILKSEGKLSLDDTIDKYLDKNTLLGLHQLDGKDYSLKITIKNLLAHTSGLPDYFQQKDNKGVSLEDKVIAGEDQFWSFNEIIKYGKGLESKFIPSSPNNAFYSDTNYQLLGKIIENITHLSYAKSLEILITKPLKLQKTYLYTDIKDNRPISLYYENKPLIIPKAMTSFGADGGIVSTSKEMQVFTEAFFSAKLFPKGYLAELYQWNDLFSPLQSGVGVHRIKLPWIFNLFMKSPELYGHSGLSGALTFYNPKDDIYISGSVNQIANPSASYKTLFKLIGAFNEK